MKVIATKCIGRDLKPGDLFSTRGDDYWSKFDRTGSVGECAYIRTNTSADDFHDADAEVYRLEIIR